MFSSLLGMPEYRTKPSSNGFRKVARDPKNLERSFWDWNGRSKVFGLGTGVLGHKNSWNGRYNVGTAVPSSKRPWNGLYLDVRVCISILHPRGDDPNGYELASECWAPVHTVGNRNNSSFVLSNFQESRLSQIKVLQREVAPATIAIRECKVRGAEVCGSDNNATGEAPFGVTVTSHLIARATTQAIVE
ncbi:hypothetical protein Fmac_026658 [Flemingia macrophylla]|uniref:Uncharacterized protein n=1 Tax=Flemingia macrophylla TaxID=520843 RepID=A0ABD1LFH4_9FABA